VYANRVVYDHVNDAAATAAAAAAAADDDDDGMTSVTVAL